MITLKVDEKTVEVNEGATVLEAARKAGAWIPTLCHHEALGSFQACRVCTVEVVQNGRSKLQASCALPAVSGMEVQTDSERVREGRKVLVELLLARAPGVKVIQDLAKRVGVTKTEYPLKNDDCILCGLCVRACSDVMGVGAIGFSGRGVYKKVETPFGAAPEVCRACGACTYVCPTGKMQMEAERAALFRKLQGWERQCRYARMGFFSSKICPRNFQCWGCEVDQAMEERFGTHPAFVSRPGEAGEIESVYEFRFAPDFHYDRGHTWVKPLNGKVRVGIDDFASRLVLPITDMFVPTLGRSFQKGEPAITVRSGGKTASLRLPVSGRVVDVNPDLLDDPGLVTRASFTRGWVATVEPENLRPELTELLHKQTARFWLSEERERLLGFVGEGSDQVAADGGLILENLPAQLDETQWSALTKQFFMA